jgi:hypothetical protein
MFQWIEHCGKSVVSNYCRYRHIVHGGLFGSGKGKTQAFGENGTN